jgi:RimJ/RimL family protein N-acetyltransferase
MSHAHWPIFDIRIGVGDLTMRPLVEADLDELARMLPPDVELNPASPTYDGAPAETARGTIVWQDYWRAMGTWTIDAWRLTFGVWRGQALIGTQELEGNDFPRLRTVDSASMLAVDERGKGRGKAMRRAVLALAFGGLQAECAISSAWQDNRASLGVSRALGYVDNGVERHRRDDGVDDMVHLRLGRDAWLASGHAAGVEVDFPDACRPYFGLADVSSG